MAIPTPPAPQVGAGGFPLAKVLLSRMGPGDQISPETLFIPPGYNTVAIEAIPEGGAPNATFTVLDAIQEGVGFTPTVDANGVISNIGVATKRNVGGIRPYVKVHGQVTSGIWTVTAALVAQPGTSTTQVPGNVSVTNFPASQSVSQGAAGALGGAWPVEITDLVHVMPTLDAAARAGFMRITDGVNLMPTLDAIARAGFFRLTDGTSSVAVLAAIADALAVTGSLDAAARLLGFNGATWDRIRFANKPIDVPSAAVVAGTPLTIWTPAAGKKFRLMGWSLSLSVAGSIIFRYAAANTLLFRTPAVAAAGFHTQELAGNGFMPGAANDPLKVDVTASGNVAGYVIGVEE